MRMEKDVGQVRQIAMSSIRVAERIRKENGSLDELAQDIQKHGLLNPITVMEQADGGYVLIAGLRRMKAMEKLNAVEIRATVMSPMEADEMLMLEIAENEQRKEFTVSEKLAFAERIRLVEAEKGKQRQLRKSAKDQKDFVVGDCPPQTDGEIEVGKVREIVAKKVGFSSDRQMRRAKELSEKRPDLMDKVDKGEQSIYGAYMDMRQAEKGDKHSFIEEEPVDIPEYQVYKPAQQEAPGNVRTVKGADHEHLLENPIYRRLYESYNDAVQQINLVRGDMRTRCEGYERRIRGYRENIQTLQREVERLKEALHAGA